MGENKTKYFSVNEALNLFEKGKLAIPIWQRGYVWTPQNRTNFIVSILDNVNINYLHIFIDPETNIKNLLDGGNRIRTLMKLINDEIKIDLLSDDKMEHIVEIDGDIFLLQEEIHRRYFSRWNPKLQKHILSSTLKYNQYTGYSIKEIKSMFSSLNMNKKLTNQEIRTTKETDETILTIDGFIKEYDLTKFMSSKNSLLKHARNKEFMYMCLMTIIYPEKAIRPIELDRFITLLNKGIPEEDRAYGVKILEYLNSTFKYLMECKVKGSIALVNKRSSTINFLNKSTCILLIQFSKRALSNNMSVKAYTKFIVEFWLSEESIELSKMSSGVQKYLVDKRYTILENFYKENYDN